MNDGEVGISVVICCHNSASRLPETLSHLSRQQIPAALRWEIIVVDNASTDATAEAASRSWARLSTAIPLRLVREETIGLSHARICGLRAARFELIAFVDDDNWLAADFLATAFSIMAEQQDVGACGGLGRPHLEAAKPDWFDHVQSGFAVGPQCVASGEIDKARGYLFGAGLCVRRSLVLCLIDNGFAFENAGRTGRQLGAGDDAELCLAISLAGWRLWYDTRLAFRHYIPDHRLNVANLRRLHRGFGQSAPALDAYRCVANPDMPLRTLRRTWLGALTLYACVLTITALRMPFTLRPAATMSWRLTLIYHGTRVARMSTMRKTYPALLKRLESASWRQHCASPAGPNLAALNSPRAQTPVSRRPRTYTGL